MIHPPQKDTSVRYRRYEDDLRSEATSRSKSPRTITSAISCCFIDLKGECFREWQHSNLIPALFIILEITLCVAIIFSFHSDTDSKAFKIGDDAVEYFFTAYMAIGELLKSLEDRKPTFGPNAQMRSRSTVYGYQNKKFLIFFLVLFCFLIVNLEIFFIANILL